MKTAINSGWIEAVPNISIGNNAGLIEALCASVHRPPNCFLVHHDSDPDANRTVLTCVGRGQALIDALISLFEATVEHIDMSQWRGVHPAIGAVDVLPLIPLGSTSVKQVDQIAHSLATQIGQRLELPVFFYSHQPANGHRRLSDLRRGGLPRLKQRLGHQLRPTYGPLRPHPRLGVTAIGRRAFMIAFNISFQEHELDIVRHIAKSIRGSNRNSVDRLPGVQALGWTLQRRGLTQVSTNITDLAATSLFDLYLHVSELALRMGTVPLGSELVGMAPIRALTPQFSKEEINDLSRSPNFLRVVDGFCQLGIPWTHHDHIRSRILEHALAATIGSNSRVW